LIFVLAGVFVVGGHCERWCPFGGVEALATYATEGNMLCSLGTSNFFILGGVLLATVLLRRAVCGYLCPLGTLGECINSLGRRMRIPRLQVPLKADRVLSLLKYAVLAIILFATWRAGELILRGFGPCYALIGRHGEDITFWAYVVSGVIALASLAVMVPFCRWLCPLAAVLNLFSWFGMTRVKRNTDNCTSCGLCAKNCPMAVPVDQLTEVTVARCTSCLSCIDSCPPKQRASGALIWGPPQSLGNRWSQAMLIAILLVCTTGGVAASYLFPMPSFIVSRGTPPARAEVIELNIENLTCRGRANLFFYFLERDDLFQLPGYMKVEAWPDPNLARVRVTVDPDQTSEDAVKQAITEPYYDAAADFWRMSPFRVEGFNPLSI
jgi:polyferredoxin